MIKLPCLLDADMQKGRPLHPLEYKLTDNLDPLSTASLSLETGEGVQMRDFVELFIDEGSAGIFRVNNIRGDHAGMQDFSLQHGLCTLSDHMHPGESTETGSCRTLLTKILSNQTIWALGTVDVPDDKDLTWECNNTNDLQGLLSVMKELPAYYLDFDQSALPWVLHVRLKPTEVSCEARFNRNLTDVEIEYDDADMCTLAYADGLDAPIKADTYNEWHEIARHVSVDKDLGVDAITETVERYLEQAKNPKATIKLTAIALSQLTGEPFDHFQKGMLCRCILEHMTVVQRIVAIERPDPISDPMNVVLTLASTQNDMSVTVAGLVVDIRRVNMLYDELAENLIIEAQTIDMLADEILLKATKEEVDIVSTRISTAEIQLNETIGQLTLKVDYNDFESEINEVSLRLDAMDSTITAKADTVDVEALEIRLNGYVTMDDFEAVQGWSTDFSGVSISGSSIVGGYGDFDELWCGSLNGESLSTAALSMGSIVSTTVWGAGADINLAHSHAVKVDGGTVTLGEVSSSGGSFNIADTQFYKDGVSAAKDSVTLTSMGWVGGVNTVEASNGKSILISLPSFSASGGDTFLADHTTTVFFYTDSVSGPLASVVVDATSVYDEGYEAGYQAACDAVVVTGGIRSITNTAANYMYAEGWASAKLDGEELDYTTFSGSQYFPNLGQ